MAKRDEVLKSAILCFTTYGYSKTTMSDIGKNVGMNKASLYYHFKDKLALYEAVVKYIRAEHMMKVNQQLEALGLEKDQIICFIKNEIDFWGNIAINYLIGQEGNVEGKEETKPVMDLILSEDVQMIKGMIDTAIKKHIFEECDSQKIAIQILRICQGLLLVSCPLNRPSKERMAGYEAIKVQSEEVIELILKGLTVK